MSEIEINYEDQLRAVLDYVKHEHVDQGLLLLLSEPELKRIFDWAWALPDMMEAIRSFVGEIEDTPLEQCRFIEGLSSFRALRSALSKGGLRDG